MASNELAQLLAERRASLMDEALEVEETQERRTQMALMIIAGWAANPSLTDFLHPTSEARTLDVRYTLAKNALAIVDALDSAAKATLQDRINDPHHELLLDETYSETAGAVPTSDNVSELSGQTSLHTVIVKKDGDVDGVPD